MALKPIPLTMAEADEQALLLRRRGLSYPAITETMSVYHGFRRAPESWRRRLRARGAAVRPHGRPYTSAKGWL